MMINISITLLLQLLLFQLSQLIVLMAISDSTSNKIFFIELTSTNLSHRMWVISFRFETTTPMTRWRTASLHFSVVIWGGVTGLGGELEVDAIKGVESNELARLAFTVTTPLFFASSFNSTIAPIGKAKFSAPQWTFVWSQVESACFHQSFFKRSFSCSEKDIASIGASVIIQTWTVGKTVKEFQNLKNAPKKI